MEIIRTKDFERAFKGIPKGIQQLYARQEQRFEESWRDPRLHVKKVRALGYALFPHHPSLSGVFLLSKLGNRNFL